MVDEQSLARWTRTRRLRAGLWLLVAVLWLSLGVGFVVRTRPSHDLLKAHGGVTTATVVVVTGSAAGQRGSIGLLYVVDRKVYAQTKVIGAAANGYLRGQVIPVYYDRAAPVRFSLGETTRRTTLQRVVALLLLAIGVLLLGVALAALRRLQRGVRLARSGEWSEVAMARSQVIGNAAGRGSKVFVTLADGRLLRTPVAWPDGELLVATRGARALLCWPSHHELVDGRLPRNARQRGRWEGLLGGPQT